MTKKIEFSQEQIDLIIKYHYDGFTNEQIGKMFNVSKSTIMRVLHENNVPYKHPWMNEERERNILDCYNECHNLAEVGRRLHVGAITVKKILIKNNIEVWDQSHVGQKYTLNEFYFDVLDTAEKCYYFGLLLADGYLNEKINTLVLSLQERDVDIIESFNNAIGSNRPIELLKLNEKNSNWQNQRVLRITNKHFKESLVEKGLISNKSLIVTFPVGIVPEEFYPAFILGYSDGDGHYSSNPKDKRINMVANLEFCEFLKTYIKDKLNINSSIFINHASQIGKPTRVFQIAGGKQVKKYLDWLYNNCDVHLNRKYQIYKNLYCESDTTNNSLSD